MYQTASGKRLLLRDMYEGKTVLGQGSFGVAVSALFLLTRTPAVLKLVRRGRESPRERPRVHADLRDGRPPLHAAARPAAARQRRALRRRARVHGLALHRDGAARRARAVRLHGGGRRRRRARDDPAHGEADAARARVRAPARADPPRRQDRRLGFRTPDAPARARAVRLRAVLRGELAGAARGAARSSTWRPRWTCATTTRRSTGARASASS